MQTALIALESAKNNLDRATSDKGGHREAIDYVKDAISEVRRALSRVGTELEELFGVRRQSEASTALWSNAQS